MPKRPKRSTDMTVRINTPKKIAAPSYSLNAMPIVVFDAVETIASGTVVISVQFPADFPPDLTDALLEATRRTIVAVQQQRRGDVQ